MKLVIASGSKEIVLTGIHLGYYNKMSLAKLIEKLLRIKGDFRYW
jgi:tRNA A37 methylthiotransferase MiaB